MLNLSDTGAAPLIALKIKRLNMKIKRLNIKTPRPYTAALGIGEKIHPDGPAVPCPPFRSVPDSQSHVESYSLSVVKLHQPGRS